MKDGLNELIQVRAVHRLAQTWLGARSSGQSKGVLVLAFVVASFVLAWLAIQVLGEREAMRQAENEAAAMQARQTPLKPALQSTPALTARQLRMAHGVIDRLNVPWAAVLDDLEAHTPTSIAILQLEPEVSSGSLSMLVEAKRTEDVFHYLEALQPTSSLKRWRVVKYETNTQDASRPVRFVLKADLASARRAALPESADATARGAR